MRTTPKIIIASLAIVAGALFLTAGPAGAQDNGSGAYVENTTVTNNPPLTPEVKAANVSQSSLAFTGGDVAGLALIGGFAVALGGLLIVSRRRAATVA